MSKSTRVRFAIERALDEEKSQNPNDASWDNDRAKRVIRLVFSDLDLLEGHEIVISQLLQFAMMGKPVRYADELELIALRIIIDLDLLVV